MTAPSPNRTYQQLRSHLAFLKLHAAAEHLAPVLDAHSDDDHVTVLEKLLGIEADATRTRRTESRRRLAGLPAAWRLDDFDYDAQPGIDPKLINDLATMRFLDDAGNVLFIGPPAVGNGFCLRRRMSNCVPGSSRSPSSKPRRRPPSAG
ncbi:ATP-binding protein [Euzebya rosea]|uniref:ATP-binding protein n=1 Tax=Euzebya rosea TaxID=2052804 RepID=UPI000D3E8830|nr:ATP-binding protein [Euzebya rosea]